MVESRRSTRALPDKGECGTANGCCERAGRHRAWRSPLGPDRLASAPHERKPAIGRRGAGERNLGRTEPVLFTHVLRSSMEATLPSPKTNNDEETGLFVSG